MAGRRGSAPHPRTRGGALPCGADGRVRGGWAWGSVWPTYGPRTAYVRPTYGPRTAYVRPTYGPRTAYVRPHTSTGDAVAAEVRSDERACEERASDERATTRECDLCRRKEAAAKARAGRHRGAGPRRCGVPEVRADHHAASQGPAVLPRLNEDVVLCARPASGPRRPR